MIAHVLVRVKPEVPDNQGEVILQSSRERGLTQIQSVNCGKYFVIDLGLYDAGRSKAMLEEMCRKLLANPVYEQFAIYRIETTEQDRVNLLEDVKKIVRPHTLDAEYLGNAQSVGVGGDARTYTPVIVLTGPFPGWDVLRELSNLISNTTPINRVTYDFTPR